MTLRKNWVDLVVAGVVVGLGAVGMYSIKNYSADTAARWDAYHSRMNVHDARLKQQIQCETTPNHWRWYEPDSPQVCEIAQREIEQIHAEDPESRRLYDLAAQRLPIWQSQDHYLRTLISDSFAQRERK